MILSNQVRCHKCGDTPFSGSRHDYKPCRCGSIAVDGGMAYLRRVGDISGYDDMSIEIPDDVSKEALSEIAVVREKNMLIMSRESVTRVLQKAGIINEVPVEAKEAANELVFWCAETGRNDLGVLCAIARAYRDNDVEFKAMARG